MVGYRVWEKSVVDRKHSGKLKNESENRAEKKSKIDKKMKNRQKRRKNGPKPGAAEKVEKVNFFENFGGSPNGPG